MNTKKDLMALLNVFASQDNLDVLLSTIKSTYPNALSIDQSKLEDEVRKIRHSIYENNRQAIRLGQFKTVDQLNNIILAEFKLIHTVNPSKREEQVFETVGPTGDPSMTMSALRSQVPELQILQKDEEDGLGMIARDGKKKTLKLRAAEFPFSDQDTDQLRTNPFPTTLEEFTAYTNPGTSDTGGQNLQQVRGSTVALKPIDYIINVNSRSRNLELYPRPDAFQFLFKTSTSETSGKLVNFDVITDFSDVEILYILVPNIYRNNDYIEPNFYVIIDELVGAVGTTSEKLTNIFAVVNWDITTVMDTSSDFIRIMGTEIIPCSRSLPSILKSLTFRLVDPYGAPMDFGNDKFTITSISTADPAVVTTSSRHYLNSNEKIFIRDVTGSGRDDVINRDSGFKIINPLSSTTFSVTIPFITGITLTEATNGYVLRHKAQVSIVAKVKQ